MASAKKVVLQKNEASENKRLAFYVVTSELREECLESRVRLRQSLDLGFHSFSDPLPQCW